MKSGKKVSTMVEQMREKPAGRNSGDPLKKSKKFTWSQPVATPQGGAIQQQSFDKSVPKAPVPQGQGTLPPATLDQSKVRAQVRKVRLAKKELA